MRWLVGCDKKWYLWGGGLSENLRVDSGEDVSFDGPDVVDFDGALVLRSAVTTLWEEGVCVCQGMRVHVFWGVEVHVRCGRACQSSRRRTKRGGKLTDWARREYN